MKKLMFIIILCLIALTSGCDTVSETKNDDGEIIKDDLVVSEYIIDESFTSKTITGEVEVYSLTNFEIAKTADLIRDYCYEVQHDAAGILPIVYEYMAYMNQHDSGFIENQVSIDGFRSFSTNINNNTYLSPELCEWSKLETHATHEYTIEGQLFEVYKVEDGRSTIRHHKEDHFVDYYVDFISEKLFIEGTELSTDFYGLYDDVLSGKYDTENSKIFVVDGFVVTFVKYSEGEFGNVRSHQIIQAHMSELNINLFVEINENGLGSSNVEVLIWPSSNYSARYEAVNQFQGSPIELLNFLEDDTNYQVIDTEYNYSEFKSLMIGFLELIDDEIILIIE